MFKVFLPLFLFFLTACGETFRPTLDPVSLQSPRARATDVAAYYRFIQQFNDNRNLPVDHQRNIVILVMTPAYGTLEQIRAGNMGHAAIEFNGRLHDMGSLNGYAYAFSSSPGLPDWSFPSANIALSKLVNHPDSDGYLNEITRFDVTVTDHQVNRLQMWWDQLETAMRDPSNSLYCWNGWQCATTVSQSLKDAGITIETPSTPQDLKNYLQANLRNTCGPTSGKPSKVAVVQKADCLNDLKNHADLLNWLILLELPRVVLAGTRSRIYYAEPDGAREPVVWSDTQEYRRRIKIARIAPMEAVRRCVKSASIQGAQIVPNFMIGQWYHVDCDHVIGQASLGGWYINADSGKVVYREDSHMIRFDLFGGDRIVDGWNG